MLQEQEHELPHQEQEQEQELRTDFGKVDTHTHTPREHIMYSTNYTHPRTWMALANTSVSSLSGVRCLASQEGWLVHQQLRILQID